MWKIAITAILKGTIHKTHFPKCIGVFIVLDFKKGPFKITYKNVLWLTQPKKIKLKLVLPRFTAKYLFTISTLVISPVNSVGLLFQFWGVKCCYIHYYLVPQRWKLLKPATWCRNEHSFYLKGTYQHNKSQLGERVKIV